MMSEGPTPISVGGLIEGRPLDRRSASLETTPRTTRKVSGDFGDQKARRLIKRAGASPIMALFVSAHGCSNTSVNEVSAGRRG